MKAADIKSGWSFTWLSVLRRLVRFLFSLLIKLFYRVQVVGQNNINTEGPAVLICNHVSWIDALVLNAAQKRPIRFVMDRQFYNIWWLKPICKLMQVVPISSADGAREIINSFKKARAALDKGRWYNTGDIADVDADGFLKIKDRLRRFSKIAGEMVGHLRLEEIYLHGLNTTEQVVAVTSVPESRKGEELVVLYLEEAVDADKLHRIADNSAVPNIWKPRRDNYIKIKSMPMLGSGKLDITHLRKIAQAAKDG